MFCHRGDERGFHTYERGYRRRSGGPLSTLFTVMLILGLTSVVFGSGATTAFVGGVFLLPFLLLKMAFTVVLVAMVAKLLFGAGRRRRPVGPGWWEDDRRDMTPQEAEWERYLQQARDEVERIDRSDPDA